MKWDKNNIFLENVESEFSTGTYSINQNYDVSMCIKPLSTNYNEYKKLETNLINYDCVNFIYKNKIISLKDYIVFCDPNPIGHKYIFLSNWFRIKEQKGIKK